MRFFARFRALKSTLRPVAALALVLALLSGCNPNANNGGGQNGNQRRGGGDDSGGGTQGGTVPEISASGATAALACVAGLSLLLLERRRSNKPVAEATI